MEAAQANRSKHRFPFGQPLRPVEQTDCAPKKVFVLGVYASAVHARWIGPDKKNVVKALAIASEPYIFWRGEGADEIIRRIEVPSGIGKLVAAEPQFNGPSGQALDEAFLKPLGFGREDAWLCDLVPYSCVNEAQQRAIERTYKPIAEKHGLPVPTVPSVPQRLTDEDRRRAILAEFRESRARLLVLLGDQPIKWFLRFYDNRWNSLGDFGRDGESYGRRHSVGIDGMKIEVLPLAHPRQVARLGKSSVEWCDLHRAWIERMGRGDSTA